MRVCIVPMKPLAAAKARLAPLFTPDERRALSIAMLADVLTAARALDEVWVLHSDADAADAARAAGAVPKDDPAPGAGLNASIDAATSEAVRRKATGVLVIAADVPLATPELVLEVSRESGVAVAPSRDGTGTNALWREPPAAIRAAFGDRSREAHAATAQASGLPLREVIDPSLGLDIDSPADVEELSRVIARGMNAAPRTTETLRALGFAVPRAGRP